jgi:DNA topoisomerase I
MKHILTYKLFEGKDEIKPTTEKELNKRWDKKRSAILKLGKDIKRLRQKVSKDMDSDDEKTRMIATIVRIMDLTGERIGNENSKSDGHHGVSNFYKKHIKIDGDTVSLSYTGKSGVKHRISVKDSKVARNLREFMKIPGEVFITTDGLSVKSTQVNKYLSDFDITSKDLRGYRVNKLMSERLRKLNKPETIGEIKKKFNDVLRDVAEQIGHTPGICRKNYLLPEIEEQWYKGKEVQKV